MNTEKEDQIIKKRLIDSAHMAYEKGIDIYTDFLGLAEQNLFFQLGHELPPISYSLYGGTDHAERICICYHGSLETGTLSRIEASEEAQTNFPIACVEISQPSAKYSSALSHRDYLGAILNLGISRSKIGDIFIQNSSAYVFCTNSISTFLCNELLMVKHTAVHCEIVIPDRGALAPTLQYITRTVPSLRLDALIAAAFASSRSSMTDYIDAGKVFINGRVVTKAGTLVDEEDIVSVRGCGRFSLGEVKNTTKKGRIAVVINKYIS